MSKTFFTEQRRISKIDPNNNDDVLATFFNKSSIEQSMQLSEAELFKLAEHPLSRLIMMATMPVASLELANDHWLGFLLASFEEIDASKLTILEMVQLEKLRVLIRFSGNRGLIPLAVFMLLESTLDIWNNIASGGVIYLDSFICAVYKANPKTLHPGKSEFKIAIKTTYGLWSYLPISTKVPISSYRNMKRCFCKLKKNPKFTKIKGTMTEANLPQVIKLVRLLGLYVSGKFACLHPV